MSSSIRQLRLQHLRTEIRGKCESIIRHSNHSEELSDLKEVEDTLEDVIDIFECKMSKSAGAEERGGSLMAPAPQIHSPGQETPGSEAQSSTPEVPNSSEEGTEEKRGGGCLAKYVQLSRESPEFSREDEPLLNLVEAACDHAKGTDPNPHNRVVLYGKHGTEKWQFAVGAAEKLGCDLLHVDLLTFSNLYHNGELGSILEVIEEIENLVIYMDGMKELMQSGDELKQHAIYFMKYLISLLASWHPGVLLFVGVDELGDLPDQLRAKLCAFQVASPMHSTLIRLIEDELANYQGHEVSFSQMAELAREFPKASQETVSLALNQVHHKACQQLWKSRRFHYSQTEASKIECCSNPSTCPRPDAYTNYKYIPKNKRPEAVFKYKDVRQALRSYI